jgi:hypothetical protein
VIPTVIALRFVTDPLRQKCRVPLLRCAVFNLVPRAWKRGVEVMDLRRVNQFTPFLSPVLPYLWPETYLLENTLVWTSEQLTWLNFV